MKNPSVSRRNFLQLSAGSLGALGAAAYARPADKTVSIIVDSRFTASRPVILALQELATALDERGFALQQVQALEHPTLLCIVAAAPDSPLASAALERSSTQLPHKPEALALVSSAFEGKRGVLACATDARGMMYALRELADRVRHDSDPLRALQPCKPVVAEPFNEVRSLGRLFVSDVQDRPWLEDRSFWPPYLSMLAAQRFNRLHLAFGIGYDSLQGVTDAYLLFPYPFLLATPGYAVHAVQLADEVRERNLGLLQYISSEAVAHGLDFQLGIWTHGYQWADSPHATYTIAGLTPDTHAPYSRDSLAALLRACPAITGVTLRTHGESGVREGSYAFWRTVFEGAAQCGRKVELDLHTKGLDQTMIDGALATGLPVRLSPKYWAEHVGLPYQQASIRELERRVAPEHTHPESRPLSTGSRSFTRYGYADFLREDRPYSVLFRIWPGTHRLLLSGDPATTAAHARAFRFCGANGAELFEPLSFKGRRGSGQPDGRCAYADESLQPARDWQKFEYTYRLWGRLLYDPQTPAESWRRYLGKRFHEGASSVEAALGNASRILPLVTTAHMPSAANDTYFPELYTNQPIADPSAHHPYGDTPAPKVFSNVSPLDPQLFCACRAYAEESLSRQVTGRYSPLEVAAWLDELAAAATHHLAQATRAGAEPSAQLRRVASDVRIQAGLGRFFAAKLRSGVLYALYTRSGSHAALRRALQEYRRARTFWSQMAQGPGKVYVSDLTFGPLPHQRGHWRDRLPAIDADIAVMARQLAAAKQTGAPEHAEPAMLLEIHSRGVAGWRHTQPPHFVKGAPLQLILYVPPQMRLAAARLHYRHVDQAEDYRVIPLECQAGQYRATIPGSYTESNYALQYFFEAQPERGAARLYPGFSALRTNQPYFLVRAAGALT
jgi:hypothetical protein